jgi:uncharacterized HhH-GPD family protein
MTAPRLRLTGDERGDELLSTNAFALLIGMLLDQQIRMEIAFLGPSRLRDRLGIELTPANVAASAPERIDAAFREKPAIHRFPGAMAKRVQALAQMLVDDYDGDAEAVWRDVREAKDVHARLSKLPGFGPEKASIFLALLGKQVKVRPRGWREAAGEYGQEGFRSIADVVSQESLLLVRESKQAVKAADRALQP